ncbi:MAG: hypothetical protein VYA62_14600, partial [Planctomycetota bacterium]|nr:hypothetical protein [Planctomycetota bacterium]
MALDDLVDHEVSANRLEVGEVAKIAAPAVPARAIPRVWTVFLAMVLAIGAIVVSQVALLILLATVFAFSGVDSQDLQSRVLEIVGHPAGFIGLGLASQLVIGLAAVLPAMFSRSPFRQRLGLLPSSLPAWGLPVVMVGSL